ncbi:MAG: hypothetical protein ACYDAO_05215 [Thermoplasmataceae archaeon]
MGVNENWGNIEGKNMSKEKKWRRCARGFYSDEEMSYPKCPNVISPEVIIQVVIQRRQREISNLRRRLGDLKCSDKQEKISKHFKMWRVRETSLRPSDEISHQLNRTSEESGAIYIIEKIFHSNFVQRLYFNKMETIF